MKPSNKGLLPLSDDEQTAKLYTQRNRKKASRKKPVGTVTFGEIIDEQISTKFHGFIYTITFSSGEFYIGKKSFEKGENWTTYKSSSKIVKERLKTETAKFKVLFYCKSSGELSYKETRELFMVNALENPLCLNENICGRYFRKNVQKYPSPVS